VVSGTATIEDLDSTNGTFVNGTRISVPTPVAPGNLIALGSEVLQLRMRGPAAQTVKIDSARESGDLRRTK
jgi:pSer/pThr/pTyr-binding forkhead associated (FHA) protein